MEVGVTFQQARIFNTIRKKIQTFCSGLFSNRLLTLEFTHILSHLEPFLAKSPKTPRTYILVISFHNSCPAHTEGQSHTVPDSNEHLPRDRKGSGTLGTTSLAYPVPEQDLQTGPISMVDIAQTQGVKQQVDEHGPPESTWPTDPMNS